MCVGADYVLLVLIVMMYLEIREADEEAFLALDTTKVFPRQVFSLYGQIGNYTELCNAPL